MYTLRSETRHDLLGTLKAVAGLGYRGVEFAGLQGVDPVLVRHALDTLGMTAAAAHIPLQRWEHELGDVLNELHALGCVYAVVPWLEPERRGNLAEAERIAEVLDAVGMACARRGVTLCWHHHDFEFAPLPGTDGRTMFDVLVERTDPANVKFELDLYWAHVGGVDLLALINRMSGRVPLVHLKDSAAADDRSDRGIPRDLPVGSGILDWPALLPAAEAAGARWYIVEQDNPNPENPMADVASAWRYLERAMG